MISFTEGRHRELLLKANLTGIAMSYITLTRNQMANALQDPAPYLSGSIEAFQLFYDGLKCVARWNYSFTKLMVKRLLQRTVQYMHNQKDLLTYSNS